MSGKKMLIQKLGGSYQFIIKSPDELKHIPDLNVARWAASAAATENLNCDQKFLEFLDSDKNGRIRADEVKEAYFWLKEVLKNFSVLNSDSEAALDLSEINDATDKGRELLAAVGELLKDCVKDNKVRIEDIRAKAKTQASGPLKGNGIITAAAFNGTLSRQLSEDIISVTGGVAGPGGEKGISELLLEGFLSDADTYLKWENNPDIPAGQKFSTDYPVFGKLRGKLDEYFDYCRMIILDPANRGRFTSTPYLLPELDIKNHDAVQAYLQSAPLASPCPETVIDFEKDINPFYKDDAADFVNTFAMQVMTLKQWQQLKERFAAYEEYLIGKDGNRVDRLGSDKLNRYLKSPALEKLRNLLKEDNNLKIRLRKLSDLEKLILFKQHFFRFTRNFVSFGELFTPGRHSMIQAGTVIMDGRCFDLTIRIKDDIQEHKKIAAKCNMYIMYLKLKSRDKTKDFEEKIMHVAVAVAGGGCSRLYIGKPGIFIGWDGIAWDARIVDIVNGPVSLLQSLLLPLNNFSNFMSEKLDKITSIANIQQTLNKSLAVPAADAAKTGANALSGGSIMVLCGSIGLAAIGSSIAFIIKSLSAVSGWRIAGWVILILLIISLPPVISGIYKLRKRNLGLFLEAAGWAINLPLRLNAGTGSIFTYTPRYPAEANIVHLDLIRNYIKIEPPSPECRCRPILLWIAVIFAVITGIVIAIANYLPVIPD
ncbi:MAG: hypothetical protein WCV67_08245 [Victivallaceae bacterium]